APPSPASLHLARPAGPRPVLLAPPGRLAPGQAAGDRHDGRAGGRRAERAHKARASGEVIGLGAASSTNSWYWGTRPSASARPRPPPTSTASPTSGLSSIGALRCLFEANAIPLPDEEPATELTHPRYKV